MNLKQNLQALLADAAAKAGYSVATIYLMDSKDDRYGDFSSNLPLLLSKVNKEAPLKIADAIIAELPANSFIVKVFSTSPGFINFSISNRYYQSLMGEIIAQNNAYGRTKTGTGKIANVEFVSANPTGPLTVGHGRNAVLGDTVANILEFHGYQVTREYYFNDAGRQMRMLGDSVAARYKQLIDKSAEFPAEGYQGDYIIGIAKQIQKQHGDKLQQNDPIFRKTAEEVIFNDIKETLLLLKIKHDVFSNEKTFYESGAVQGVVEALKSKKLIYNKDDAVWFKTTALGMDQDRVLIKNSGEPTYRLPDMAYHLNKISRRFDLIVDILGADHIDSYPDVIAAIEALGHSTKHFKVLIHQFVTLLKMGEKVKMSTRKADFVTLRELIDEVGGDVVRYFFIMRNMNSHLNFDLDLATDQSEKNPVFYLQYAYARICNILKHGEKLGIDVDSKYNTELLCEKEELDLLKFADQFHEVMALLLNTLEPQPLTAYLHELAARFHKFYGQCKVISDDLSLTAARIALIRSIQVILSSGLRILGISAPERM